VVSSRRFGACLACVLLLLGASRVLAHGPRSRALNTGDPAAATVDSSVLKHMEVDGQADFWVILKRQADLRAAFRMSNWNARGHFVHQRLQAVAHLTQARLRSLLSDRGAPFEPYWIANAIKVRGGQQLVEELALQPEVAQIVPDWTLERPEPIPAAEEPQVDAVEWNVARVGAPQVWSTFGVRGDGIVVANVDSGVQFDHPALRSHYRGDLGGGSFDHDYNWFDPSRICGNPSLQPCDNDGHGTHTMGTIVGDDGGANQIGVAPGARWIAAKGCESSSCSSSALLASGQWILAPTDLNGQNPRTDLRPQVVNNSWGGGPGNPWYEAIVATWTASGIFPAFSVGNSGPSCGSANSPGDYAGSYAAGAFDINNFIASFSSRGPSFFGGLVKPNIAAPGVSVRSSIPQGSYASFSGTSMASPHVAGTVALMWSAASALFGDVEATRALLDQTAINVSDLSCGGSAAINNVWGEGRLDAFSAVDRSPRGPTGSLQGTISDADSGLRVSGASVQAVGAITRTTTTDASGFYRFPALSVDSYDVTVTRFGYLTETAPGVDVNDGATTVQDFVLAPAPSHPVSGYVRDTSDAPLANAEVEILDTPVPSVVTDASGFFSFPAVPEGSYDVLARSGYCTEAVTQPLSVSGPVTDFDFNLPLRRDAFGYSCRVESPDYVEAGTVLPLVGDDASIAVALPFPFTFYDQTYSGSVYVTTNGNLNFLIPNAFYSNTPIPSPSDPNAAVYPFWDDLYVDGSASVRTALLGSAPNRRFVIEWRNVAFYADFSRRVDFEVLLHEDGRIATQYRNIADDSREKGISATVGIENESGSIGLQYSYAEAAIADPSHAVLYSPPVRGVIEGFVTDANDGLPISGVAVRALEQGSVVRQVTSAADGSYLLQLPLGTYAIEASSANYETASVELSLDAEDEVLTQDFALRTARAEVAPASLTFLVPQGQSRTQTLTLANAGGLALDWAFDEFGGGPLAIRVTSGLPRNPDHDPDALDADGLYLDEAPPPGPNDAGDVLQSWLPAGLSLAWGVGYTGDVWLSDAFGARNAEFDVLGAPSGQSWSTPWAAAFPGDMAYDAGRDLVCQVNVGGDNGIHCWDPDTGNVAHAITGAFPWATISQRGLAYRADDDTFYIGGWNEGILYHIKGLSWDVPGQVLDQCSPPDGDISGLAWNPAVGSVWEATNSPSDGIYRIDPDTCEVLGTLAHPDPGFSGAGLEMDETGNLWMIDQAPNTVYLIDSGVPAFVDVPWLIEMPESGSLQPGAAQQIQVVADATGLAAGAYQATLSLQTNSGRSPRVQIPVKLVVTSYAVGVNSGGGAYVDSQGELWQADREYTPGGFGYTNGSAPGGKTSAAIAGTEEDPLYQVFRTRPTDYRFDVPVNGVYGLELRFAEPQLRNEGSRLFDVIVEGGFVLPAHDITYDVGNRTADDHEFLVGVSDGQLTIRFVPRRGYAAPIVNAIRVIHRPDL
jgi:subtilisin family serine protease